MRSSIGYNNSVSSETDRARADLRELIEQWPVAAPECKTYAWIKSKLLVESRNLLFMLVLAAFILAGLIIAIFGDVPVPLAFALGAITAMAFVALIYIWSRR